MKGADPTIIIKGTDPTIIIKGMDHMLRKMARFCYVFNVIVIAIVNRQT